MRILCLFLFLPLFSFSQLSDLARLDYTHIPSAKNNIEYSRYRALVNYPFKLKNEREYFILGLDYSHININFNNNNLPFNSSELNKFQILDLNFGYTKPLNAKWRFGIRFTPGLSRNLANNDITFNDLTLSTDVVFIRKRIIDSVREDKLILGIRYSGNSGFPFPLPFINYYKKFNEKWSYNIGVPKSNLQHYFSEKSRLKLYAELDGFTANIHDGIIVNEINEAQSINMFLILGGLQYEYHFTKHIRFYARTAYIFSYSNRLRDANKEELFVIDNGSSKVYLRTGLQLKI